MKQVFALVLPVFFCNPILAATDPSVAAYSIPADAEKLGPFASRDSQGESFSYFLAGKEHTSENRIAKETYYGGILTQRQLFKNGQKYGSGIAMGSLRANLLTTKD